MNKGPGEELVENDPAFIDRRAMERAGWLFQDPDAMRGEPFERAIHPDWRARAERVPGVYPTDPKKIVQVVYVPVGAATKTWANKVWKPVYPRMYAWFIDDSDTRMAVWNGIAFIKSDF